jgi:hypothetical protein
LTMAVVSQKQWFCDFTTKANPNNRAMIAIFLSMFIY